MDILFLIGEKEIEFTAKNNKGTADVLPMHDIHGIGLKNLRRRLEYLYPDYTLETSDEGNVFFVKLIVPLQNEVEITDH